MPSLSYRIGLCLFWIIIKQCIFCQCLNKSRSPEAMVIKISLKNTFRNNKRVHRRVESKEEICMDFLLENSL